MTWIRTIPIEDAADKLKVLYDRIKGPNGDVDNIMKAHSLRPHTMEGHLAIYKYVLHHSANQLPKWFMECIGVYVSLLNSCDYCVEHHYEGMKRLLKDDDRAQAIRGALESGKLPEVFQPNELAALRYAEQLTKYPAEVEEDAIQAMRQAGYDDGEILEINQIVSYYAYANRTVLGLGVNTKGDVLGLSPSSSDENNWSHQ